ncbi:hypothetical protein C8Q75DRAFT_805544 [Abortiporus biennis]|nr:hypothetical protein C8Q75DRAFT_805544 [Abortiporus biennis]
MSDYSSFFSSGLRVMASRTLNRSRPASMMEGPSTSEPLPNLKLAFHDRSHSHSAVPSSRDRVKPVRITMPPDFSSRGQHKRASSFISPTAALVDLSNGWFNSKESPSTSLLSNLHACSSSSSSIPQGYDDSMFTPVERVSIDPFAPSPSSPAPTLRSFHEQTSPLQPQTDESFLTIIPSPIESPIVSRDTPRTSQVRPKPVDRNRRRSSISVDHTLSMRSHRTWRQNSLSPLRSPSLTVEPEIWERESIVNADWRQTIDDLLGLGNEQDFA